MRESRLSPLEVHYSVKEASHIQLRVVVLINSNRLTNGVDLSRRFRINTEVYYCVHLSSFAEDKTIDISARDSLITFPPFFAATFSRISSIPEFFFSFLSSVCYYCTGRSQTFLRFYAFPRPFSCVDQLTKQRKQRANVPTFEKLRRIYIQIHRRGVRWNNRRAWQLVRDARRIAV